MFCGFHCNMMGFNNHRMRITIPAYLGLARTTGAPPASGVGHALALHEEMDDDFLMYTYKVRRCSKTRSHDWTECPYAHRGEKARRRDPRKFPYSGVACPEFRQTGECKRGQNCEFAHGVFEFWLHPSRYRTRACEAGLMCPRRICFFAHTPEQLRPEVIKDCFRCNPQGHTVNTLVTRGRMGTPFQPSSASSSSSSARAGRHGGIVVGQNRGRVGEGAGEEEFDVPDIGWVVDLVE